MAIIKFLQIINAGKICWRGCGKKGTLLQCWWEYNLGQPLWKHCKKLKTELPYEYSNPTPRHISGEKHNSKNTCNIIMFIAVLFTIAKT